MQQSVVRLRPDTYTEFIDFLGHTVSVRPRPPPAIADGNSVAVGAGPPVGPSPSWRLEEPRAGTGVVFRAPMEQLPVVGTIIDIVDVVRMSPGKDGTAGGRRTSPVLVVSATSSSLPEQNPASPRRKQLEPVERSSEGSRRGADIVKGLAIPKLSPVSASEATEGDTVWVAAPTEEAPKMLTRSSSERRAVSAADYESLASPLRPSSPAGKLSARSSGGGVRAAQVEIRSAEADPEWDSPSAPGVPSDAT